MRVLFDSCVYDLRNRGNVAMLQTAVNRIHTFWPGATLEVITSGPYLLRLYCPNARPISPSGVDYYSLQRSLYHRVLQKMPVFLLKTMLEIREAVWYRLHKEESTLPGTQAMDDRTRTAPSHSSESAEEDTAGTRWDTQSLKQIDLYVATGGHYLTDVMHQDVLAVLERLELAMQFGASTVMVGQGIGPIKDAKLHARARAVLPKVDLFLIRETLEAPRILSALGVDSSRIAVTGDDTIEMAYRARSSQIGSDIGFGFRVTHFTEANSGHVQVIRTVLHQVAKKYECHLMGLPSSQSVDELDQKVIERIFAGTQFRHSFFQKLSEPLKTIRNISQCRIVITGTYHPAVFALSQGIPVIGLVKSPRHIIKFTGLADQFGDGLEIIMLDDVNLGDKLLAAIDRAWNLAGVIKPSLLQAAEHQIASGRKGYELIYQTLGAKQQRIDSRSVSLREKAG